MTVGHGIVDNHRHLASHLSEKLDVVFGEIILVVSSYNEETQLGAAADQRKRALSLDFLAKGKAAYSGTAGGAKMLAFTLTPGLICRIYFTRIRLIDNNVKEIEIDDHAQFGCNVVDQVFWPRRRQAFIQAQQHFIAPHKGTRPVPIWLLLNGDFRPKTRGSGREFN